MLQRLCACMPGCVRVGLPGFALQACGAQSATVRPLQALIIPPLAMEREGAARRRRGVAAAALTALDRLRPRCAGPWLSPRAGIVSQRAHIHRDSSEYQLLQCPCCAGCALRFKRVAFSATWMQAAAGCRPAGLCCQQSVAARGAACRHWSGGGLAPAEPVGCSILACSASAHAPCVCTNSACSPLSTPPAPLLPAPLPAPLVAVPVLSLCQCAPLCTAHCHDELRSRPYGRGEHPP